MHGPRSRRARCPVERPLRLAEFDDLFATALRSVEKTDLTHARLLLTGDRALAERTVAARRCREFLLLVLAFGVSIDEPGSVVFDLEVPSAYADVLAALVARADAAPRRAS